MGLYSLAKEFAFNCKCKNSLEGILLGSTVTSFKVLEYYITAM